MKPVGFGTEHCWTGVFTFCNHSIQIIHWFLPFLSLNQPSDQSSRLCFQCQRIITEMFHPKTVLLYMLHNQTLPIRLCKFMELIEIMPPLAEFRHSNKRRHISHPFAGDIKRTHCKRVDTVAGDSTQCCRNAFNNTGVYMRAFAWGQCAHSGTAENQRSFKFLRKFCFLPEDRHDGFRTSLFGSITPEVGGNFFQPLFSDELTTASFNGYPAKIRTHYKILSFTVFIIIFIPFRNLYHLYHFYLLFRTSSQCRYNTIPHQ